MVLIKKKLQRHRRIQSSSVYDSLPKSLSGHNCKEKKATKVLFSTYPATVRNNRNITNISVPTRDESHL